MHVARGADIRYVGNGASAMARAVEIGLDAGRAEVFDDTQHMTARDVAAVQRAGLRHAAVRMRKRKNLQVLRGKDHTVLIAAGSKHFDAAASLFECLAVRRASATASRCYATPTGSRLRQRRCAAWCGA